MTPRIGIVGTGIAGMGAAWQLRNHAHITLVEKLDRPGGHTNTVVVREEDREIPIDTGFIVFNHQTYPNLVRLFSELGVETMPSEMSFSVRHNPANLEYNGMGLDKLFAQRSNIARPRFHLLVLAILRFFRIAKKTLAAPGEADLTVAEFTERHRLGRDFLEFYLVPMASAVWSSDPARILDFPALSLLRFFHNHGFLGVTTHHPWFTVKGGSRTYRDRLLASFDPVRLPAEVVEVKEQEDRVTLRSSDGATWDFDHVVIAAHADEALAMLARPTPLQQRLLGSFHYQENTAILHTDPSVMPRHRRAWASWNYRVDASADGSTSATTHYWMNALQNVSPHRDYFVSINSDAIVPADKVLYRTVYTHPLFSLEAIRAQRDLPMLNTRSHDQRVFFCGSYFRHGFHEDAYSSAVDLAAIIRPLLGR